MNVDHDGELEVSKVKLQHKMSDGTLVTFEMADESKGTQRLIELLPILFDMARVETTERASKVYLVDELDRSYHSALTADLVQEYLGECDESMRNQLIFTTYDLVLTDKEILRRDELWFCLKDDDESSGLICLGNQKGVRTDSDILKNYLDGKMGGYPVSVTSKISNVCAMGECFACFVFKFERRFAQCLKCLGGVSDRLRADVGICDVRQA